MVEIYDEDTLTEFEVQRQRNIIKNYEFMKACGLPVKPLVYVKRVYIPLEEQFKYLSDSSDSSDEEWTMGPKKKKEDKNAPKSADIRIKVTNPTAFFKKVKAEEEEERKKNEIKIEAGESSQKPTETIPQKPKSKSLKRKKKEPTSTASSSTSAVENGGVKQRANGKQFIRDRPKLPPSTLTNNKDDSSDEDIESETITTRYPKRGPRINYSEAEVPDDDHYLFCEECQQYYQGECPEHCPIRPYADNVTTDGSIKARSSLPQGMVIKESGIKGAGLGVFATKAFLSGATFGPYTGEKVRADVPKVGLDTSYMWEIVKDLKVAYYINGKDEQQANWMRYINCSRVEDEQNMVAYQFHGNIFYRVYKDVQPGTEFLVWYGEEYAGELGIALECPADTLECPADVRGRVYDSESIVFKCEWCSICYTQEQDLLKHKKYCRKKPLKEHNDTIIRISGGAGNSRSRTSHLCHVCGKMFKTSYNLSLHLKVHSGEKPFSCEQCGRRFSRKHHLNGHLLTHSQEKPFKCEVCGYQCKQDSSLKRHMGIHTGETPYKCEVCGYQCKQDSSLTRHMRIHTGETPYKCEVCGYQFKQDSSLKRHMRIHTGETPYKCEVCGYQCKQDFSLKRHMRIHTGETPKSVTCVDVDANKI